MSHDEMAAAVELYASLGKTHMPMSLDQWREYLMATKSIGKVTVKAGKVKPVDTASTPQKIARKAKADRTEKALRKNREKRA